MVQIDKIDDNASASELAEKRLSVENIVGTLELGQEFDLVELENYLESCEYEPEMSPFLVYRPSNFVGTVLIPTNGLVSLVGCKSKSEVRNLGIHLIEKLSPVASEDLPSPSEIEVQNIVIQGSFGKEVQLNQITILLGVEETEYEPEQFPGVIYRPSNGTTVLIFSSGKFTVNGSTSYSQALDSINNLLSKFREAGVPMNK